MNNIIINDSIMPHIKLENKSEFQNLKIGDIISGVFSRKDGNTAIFKTLTGTAFKTPADDIIGKIGEQINFQVVDTQGNTVVMKQLLEDKEEQAKSDDLTGDELLNWTKGAVLPITGAAFRAEKIRFEQMAEQDAQMLTALRQIKRDIALSVKNVSDSSLSLLVENGISLKNVTLSMLTQAVQTAVKKVTDEPTAEEIALKIKEFANKDNSELYKKTFQSIKALIKEDLPLDDNSVKTLNSLQQKVDEIHKMSTGARFAFLKTGAEHTVYNMSPFVNAADTAEPPASLDVKAHNDMLGSIGKYFVKNGIQESDENYKLALEPC
jgi:pyruvoyl-dependent arginine decarboxylase (PvlArgDC)